MKISLKALAAAALVAVSGVASAALTMPSEGASDLAFIAFNADTKTTYVWDLGFSTSTFNTAQNNQSFSMSNFGEFAAANSGFQWFVAGANGTSAPRQLWTTGQAGWTDSQLGGINTDGNNLTDFYGAHNVAGNTEALGSTVTLASNDQGSAPNKLIDTETGSWYNTGALSGLDATATATESKILYMASNTGGRTPVKTINAYGTFSLNGNTLKYTTAPVPEPGTYALMLAGLAAVGAVVRRRAK